MDAPSAPCAPLDLGPSSPFAGIVLAGGASRRMGRDKALLQTPGREGSAGATSQGTWLERSVARLAEAGADPIWVAGGDPSWVPPGARHVPDRLPGQGPLAGIESAMQRSRAERGARAGAAWCLVLACDLPRLQGESLARLLEARSAGASAVVALGPTGLEPLVALYQDALLDALSAFLERGERSARRFLEGLGPALTRVELPAEVLHNANTPQDLEGL